MNSVNTGDTTDHKRFFNISYIMNFSEQFLHVTCGQDIIMSYTDFNTLRSFKVQRYSFETIA